MITRILILSSVIAITQINAQNNDIIIESTRNDNTVILSGGGAQISSTASEGGSIELKGTSGSGTLTGGGRAILNTDVGGRLVLWNTAGGSSGSGSNIIGWQPSIIMDSDFFDGSLLELKSEISEFSKFDIYNSGSPVMTFTNPGGFPVARIFTGSETIGPSINLTDSDNTSSIKIESEESEDRGGQITMYDRDGEVSVELDGDFGESGRLDLTNRSSLPFGDEESTPIDEMIELHHEGLGNEFDFGIGLYFHDDTDCPFIGQCSSSDPALGFSYNQGLRRGITDDGDWFKASDRRIKYDINDIDKLLEQVMKLRTKKYKLKSDKSNQQKIGFIAQQISEVFPSLVRKFKDGDEEILMVDYESMIPILTSAIQEQQVIIDADRRRIAELESDLQEIKIAIKELSKN